MTIERKALEDRLQALQRDMKELEKRYCAAQGAASECEHWMAILDAAPPPDPSETP